MAHILVVDDEWRIREMLRLLLEEDGHKVEAVPDGRSALIALQEGVLPDLILLDLAMPGIDGWRVLDELYRSGRREQTRILVVTGVEGAPSDSPDILRKPFDAASLRAAVDQALSETPEEQCARKARLAGLTAVLRPVLTD